MKTNREREKKMMMMFVLSSLRVDPWQCRRRRLAWWYSSPLLCCFWPLAWLSAYNCNLMGWQMVGWICANIGQIEAICFYIVFVLLFADVFQKALRVKFRLWVPPPVSSAEAHTHAYIQTHTHIYVYTHTHTAAQLYLCMIFRLFLANDLCVSSCLLFFSRLLIIIIIILFIFHTHFTWVHSYIVGVSSQLYVHRYSYICMCVYRI